MAAISSRRGIVSSFRGATRVLEASRCDEEQVSMADTRHRSHSIKVPYVSHAATQSYKRNSCGIFAIITGVRDAPYKFQLKCQSLVNFERPTLFCPSAVALVSDRLTRLSLGVASTFLCVSQW